jgi:two-component system sensor histidine kinase PilS (NtrC family)
VDRTSPVSSHRYGVPGQHWLAPARLAAALLLVGLTLVVGEGYRSPGLVVLAAGAAAATAVLGHWVRRSRNLISALFLLDLGWIGLAAVASGSPEVGFTLFFPLVAFGAGLTVGGRRALALSLMAGAALVVSVTGLSPGHAEPGWLAVQGLLVLVLGVVSDRTRALLLARERALVHASRALERMRLDTDTIVQNLGSGLLSLDRAGCVVHLNRAAEETLGISAEAVRGRRALEALPENLASLRDLVLTSLTEARPALRGEIEIQTDGRRVPLGVSTTILYGVEHETTGVVALFQDLTEVRRQETLARRRDRLAAVGELAAGIVHEIRNSILPLGGSVQILSQELHLDPEQQKLFEVITREMENVERFVGALLSYTRSQALHADRVDLRALAAETAEEVRLTRRDGPAIEARGEEAWAWGDPDQLRQAVRNLVLNAADAAGEGGAVMVGTGTDAEGRPWIEVQDDGPGVPAGDREKVCQPFYTSKPGGTGLGLAIVTRITEDHGGQLRLLESELGGARFRMVLTQPAEDPSLLTTAA